MSMHIYAIALGSNRLHHRIGSPLRILDAALQALDAEPLHVIAAAKPISTRPIGPSLRLYANSAALVQTQLDPAELLVYLKTIERAFGIRRGRRWSSRVLDLDIILWSGGIWTSPDLAIPHMAFRDRPFVLHPLAQIAAEWRDPMTGLSVRQLAYRQRSPKPVDRRGKPL